MAPLPKPFFNDPPISDTQRQEAIAAVQSIFDRYHALCAAHNFTGFDTALMRELTILDAHPSGRALTSLLDTPAYANLNGVLHGGAAALLFDMATTIALGPLARGGFWQFLGGVTRALNVTYLRAVPVGTVVEVVAEVVQVGKRASLIRGTMRSGDGKTVYAVVDHHKVHAEPVRGHMDVGIGEGKGKEKL